MAYTRLHWVESETPLSAQNMNNIEDGIEELQAQKVNKVSGKGLSTNDYTTADKNKLSNIQSGATDASIIDLVYPVGAIYMSVLSTDPGTLFGRGTWKKWGAGRVPVGVDTEQTEFSVAEALGGYKTHTLTTEEIPSHNHTYTRATAEKVSTEYNMAYTTAHVYPWDAATVTTGNAGGGQAHNNLQPYITCYMWKRTS